MKAAVVFAKGDLRLEERPIPQVPAGSIRVCVKSCAICGTDLRIYRKGDHRASYPVIIGHEIAGIVDAVNSLDLESGVILTYDHEGEREVNGLRVSVLPVWKWLLAENSPDFQ